MRNPEQILEFDVIKKILGTYALTELGKTWFLAFQYKTDIHQIKEELAKTKEALRIIFAYTRLPIEFIHNIEPYLEKALKNSLLHPEELYRIGSQSRGIVQMRSFMSNVKLADLQHFSYFINSLHPCKELKKAIDDRISPQLEIMDSASPTLNRIRKDIRAKESEIRRRLDSIIRSKPEYLADSIITMRNDRLVIPVKNSFKNSITGIIHDQSDSLQTAYIEPMAVVELNYEIASLKIQERDEIEKILAYLTGLVRDEYEILKTNLEMITELDIMFAKGQYAKDLDAYIPEITDRQEIYFPSARHPLIDQKKVIANDFSIGGDDKNIMLITGPNTGGKTVGLKTIGLLTMMVQSGLAIPTKEGARCGVFGKFFVDIGDDQSIEQSLSTFSSHMARLIDMVKNVDNRSLVLLDEIGGGTSPNEGEAIAMALFDYFASKNALLIATTHYSNLKSYALDKGNIISTSMEFDRMTMRPTYHLIKGVFGSSYALEISRNLGLDESIINQAKKYKDYYANMVDQLSEKLDKKIIDLDQKEKELITAQKQIEELKNQLQKEIDKSRELNLELIHKSQEKIDDMVAEALIEIDSIKTEMMKKNDFKLHHYIDAKRNLQNVAPSINDELSQEQSIEVGDFVLVKSINKIGRIVRKKDNDYTINVNGITIQTKGNDLEIKTDYQEKPILITTRRVNNTKSQNSVPLELNLIGMRVDEAILKVDKYLDDAMSVYYKNIRIIHGMGTGALRRAVHEYLDQNKYVVSYRLGGAGEGGLGATVVTLK